MDKAGWQVTAAALGLGMVGCAFGLVANVKALAQANEELKGRAVTETVTVHEVHQARCIDDQKPPMFEVTPRPEGSRCMGGRLLLRHASGWDTVMHKGRPVACTDE